MSTFIKLSKVSKKFYEKNDCSVKAIAILGNLPYKYAHEAMEREGRLRRDGASTTMILRAVRKLNIWCDKVELEGKTVRTLGRNLPKKGRFLIFTDGHVLAAVDGEIVDWTSGRLHRIESVYKISF